MSTRQITILLTVYLEAPPHTVRELAQKLGVSKPVITRALDSMGKHRTAARRRDEKRPPQRPGSANRKGRPLP